MEAFAAYTARIGTKKYTSFQKAVDSAKSGQTVTLLRSISSKKGLRITDKRIVINFAGKKFYMKNKEDYAFIIRNSRVTIKNTALSSVRNALYIDKNSIVYVNNGAIRGMNANFGTLWLKGGTYAGNGTDTNASGSVLEYLPAIKNYGSLRIDKGTFKGSKRPILHNSGTAVLNNGEFKATNALAFVNFEDGTLQIKGGNFIATSSADTDYLLSNRGKTRIEGGSFYGTIHNLALSKQGMLLILEGSFQSANGHIGLYNEEGRVTIVDGTFSSRNHNTLFNGQNGTLMTTGGQYWSSGTSKPYAVWNEGAMALTGGEFFTNGSGSTDAGIGCKSTSHWLISQYAQGILDIQ